MSVEYLAIIVSVIETQKSFYCINLTNEEDNSLFVNNNLSILFIPSYKINKKSFYIKIKMRAEQLRLRAEREKARQEAERIEKERKEAEAGKS